MNHETESRFFPHTVGGIGFITDHFFSPLFAVEPMQSDDLEQYNTKLKQLQSELDDLRGSLDYLETESDRAYGKIDIHGFVSQGFLKSDGVNLISRAQDGTFELNEMAINVGSQLNSKLRVGMQLMSRDFGETDNNKVKLDWALVDYHGRDWLGLRAGRLKMPTGMYSETRDIDALRTSILLPINNLYHENWREVFGYTHHR